jgi:glycosyltransferase involved in cell wall biosynthesis
MARLRGRGVAVKPVVERGVLYVNHTSVISGAEAALLEHLRVMPPPYAAGPVLCPPGELTDALGRAGVAAIPFPGTSVGLRLSPRPLALAVRDTARGAIAIRRAARRSGSAVTHANSIRAGLMAVAARAIGGPPVIVHIHDVLPAGRAGRLVRRILLRGSSALVAVSDYTRAAFLDGLGEPGKPFPVVLNPLDIERITAAAPDRATARRRLSLPAGGPVLGMVGQITPWKGQHTAIETLAIVRRTVPDVRLVIAGEPRFVHPDGRYDNSAYAAGLASLAEQLGVGDVVEFIGQSDDVPAVMRALDVLLLPSSVEPLGRVVLEAMALGTPVIATDVGGPRELIEHGRSGFLAPPAEPERWAESVVALVQDRELAANVSRHASQVLAERLSSIAYRERMVALYDAVAGT